MILPTLLLLAAQESLASPSKREPAIAVIPSSRAQALSPDGTELAFTVDDGSIGFCTLSSATVRLRVDGFPKWLGSIAWSPDGASVAVLSEGERVRIVRAVDGTIESEFRGSPAPKLTHWWSRDVRFVDGGKSVLLCGDGAPVQLRKRDGTLIAELSPEKECTSTTCAIAPDSKLFAAGDTCGNVGVWTADEGRLQGRLLHVPHVVNCLAFDPSGRRLAVGAGDCTVRIFEVGSNAKPKELSHCDQDLFGGLEIGSVEFSLDGKCLVTTSFSYYEVRLWDLATNSRVWAFDYGGGNAPAIRAQFTPRDGSVITSFGEVHSVADGKRIRSLTSNPSHACGSFEADRGRAWEQKDGVLSIFDIADGKKLADVPLARTRDK